MDAADRAGQLRRAKEEARIREVNVTLPVWVWGFAQEALELRAAQHRNVMSQSRADYEQRKNAYYALTKAAEKITETLEDESSGTD